MKSRISALSTLLVLSLAATTAFAGSIGESVAAIYRNREALAAFVTQQGAWGPVVFIAVQAFQVVVAPIPGELTGALAGILFGGFWGTVYATLGLTLGSALAFGIGRALGQPVVERLVGAKALGKLAYLTEAKGIFATLLFFLVPGMPKDLGCYVLGLSPMGFWPFLVATSLARLPGTLALSLSGDALAAQDWPVLITVIVATAGIAALAFIYREPIAVWVKRFDNPD